MSNIQQKLSLLDALSNSREGTFYIYDVTELIINDVCIPVGIDKYLMVDITNDYARMNVIKDDKKIFFFETELDKIRDLHIFLKEWEMKCII